MTGTQTPYHLDEHEQACLAIRGALSALRLTRVRDEDVREAMNRLENWLIENDGAWRA